MKLRITKETYSIIKNDALSAYPHECCGFLFGKETDEYRIITHALPVVNSQQENKNRRFEIASTDYMKAEQFADENQLTLLGVYHSHPDHPAIPSEHDLKQALPFFSYIIVSVRKGHLDKMLSWRLNDKGKFAEEKMEPQTEYTQTPKPKNLYNTF
jgi:proteasome lid subunit RPN8/RPN11